MIFDVNAVNFLSIFLLYIVHVRYDAAVLPLNSVLTQTILHNSEKDACLVSSVTREDPDQAVYLLRSCQGLCSYL